MREGELLLELESVLQLTPSTRQLDFRRVDGGGFRYQPGQFYRFVFEDAKGQFERSYSAANFDGTAGTGDRLSLVISGVSGGRATGLLLNPALNSLTPGLRCRARGPYGRLVLPQELPPRLILVATSVGLAPYLPMLDQLAAMGRDGKVAGCVELVLGVRTPEEFLCERDLCDYASRHGYFGLTVCFSRSMPARPGSCTTHSGRVQEGIRSLSPDPATDLVFLCGNPNMIDEVYAQLRELGFPGRRVLREKYVYARDLAADQAAPLTDDQRRLIAAKLEAARRRGSD